MFIATPAPEAQPSSVGAAWVGCVAVRQGLGESGGAPGHKHAAPTGLGEPCGAVGYKHVAPTGLSGLGGARRLNPKPEAEGRKKAETRRPKPESRSASSFGIRISEFGLLSALGLRSSDFKAVRLATNMPPLRGLTDLVARLAINMSPLRGWSDRAVRLAISFSLSPSEGERAGVRGMARGSNPKAESRSALGFTLRISKLEFAKEYYEYE